MTKRGRQVYLGTSLQGVMGRLGRKSGDGAVSARVSTAWMEIVGPAVKGHTTGAFMKEGVLIVYVDSPAWATELSAMSERYRGALNEKIGEELVREVRFSVSRKVVDQHRIALAEQEVDDFYKEDDVPSVALTPIEIAQIEASVSVIEDEELREAVYRATVRDLEWKKGIAQHSSREEPRQGL